MQPKKYGRTSSLGVAWHIKHIIDVIYHWILKHVFRRYPIQCGCYANRWEFNLPTMTIPYYKTKPGQLAGVDIDENNVRIKLDSEEDIYSDSFSNGLMSEKYSELLRQSLLKAAKEYKEQKQE